MFDALTSKLNDVFRGLRGRGKITEGPRGRPVMPWRVEAPCIN